MVTPAKFPTVTDLPVRRWKSVDFPVLGLPTSAIFTGANLRRVWSVDNPSTKAIVYFFIAHRLERGDSWSYRST